MKSFFTKALQVLKKIIRTIKREFVWFTSDRVLEAINNGASYEEVKALVDYETDTPSRLRRKKEREELK